MRVRPPTREVLERAGREAAGYDHVVQIEGDPTERGERRETQRPAARRQQRIDHEHAERTVPDDRPQRREKRVAGVRQERPAAVGVHGREG